MPFLHKYGVKQKLVGISSKMKFPKPKITVLNTTYGHMTHKIFTILHKTHLKPRKTAPNGAFGAFWRIKIHFCEYDVDWYSRISIMKYGNDRFLQSWWIFHSDGSLPIQVCYPVHWIARISIPSIPLIHYDKANKKTHPWGYLSI